MSGGITYGAGREARLQFMTTTRLLLLIAAGCAIVLSLVASANLKATPRRVLVERYDAGLKCLRAVQGISLLQYSTASTIFLIDVAFITS